MTLFFVTIALSVLPELFGEHTVQLHETLSDAVMPP